MFIKYQHVERYGTEPTEGIDIGNCHIFPKLDGANGSIWFEDGEVCISNRNRKLCTEDDHMEFYETLKEDDNVKDFFKEYPTLKLYGEWMKEHTLRTYVDNAWDEFYIFDIMDGDFNYLTYESYKDICEKFNLNYIPVLCEITDPTSEQLYKCLDKNTYLIKDGCGFGEGIVIKNYDYRNRHDKQIWAKIVRNEFKEQNRLLMGHGKIKGGLTSEKVILQKYCTKAFIQKEYNKLTHIADGWKKEYIPRLLSTIWTTLIREECYNFIKKLRNPTIDFNKLQRLVTNKTKEVLKEIF